MGAKYHRRRTSRRRNRRRVRSATQTALTGIVLVSLLAVLSFVMFFGIDEKMQMRFGKSDTESDAPIKATPTPSVFEIRLSGATAQPEMEHVATALFPARQQPPRVLIYHTHATEAYTMTKQSEYEPSDEWRTNDNTKSVVAVGKLLSETLRAQGIQVLHDPTDHEPPKLSSAYSRSEITMKTYRSLYPDIALYIDIHRDAYGSEAGIRDVAIIDGQETARVMFVVGTGEGATGTGFPEMPDFEKNYALAVALTKALSEIDGELVRPVRIKTGRYNQHISNACLLIEVGHNQNTLEQALSSVPYLASVIADYLNGNGAAETTAPKTGTVWVP